MHLEDWNLEAPIRAVPAAVNAALSDYFGASDREFGGIDPMITESIEVLKNFVLNGGKRVRPMFAWAGIRAGLQGGGGSAPSNTSPQAYVKAISSLELIQACALIHDDIIDASDTRRGFPTVHRTFESQHRERSWHGSAEHYGISQAILTGDLAFSWADDIFNDSGVPLDALAAARPAWRAMRTEVIAGQQMDIEVEHRGSESEADSLKVIRYKTASYSVARPLHIGATLVGADHKTINLLLEFGRKIGTVFQLRDDQLGVFGDPEVTGKPSGDDLRSGKRTLLINRALSSGTRAEVAELRAGLGHPEAIDNGDITIDRLRDIIVSTGAAEAIERQITALSDQAMTSVQESWLDAGIVEELIHFSRALSHRKF